MNLPDHILKRMHKEFRLWQMAEETREKFKQLDQGPEMKREFQEKGRLYFLDNRHFNKKS